MTSTPKLRTSLPDVAGALLIAAALPLAPQADAAPGPHAARVSSCVMGECHSGYRAARHPHPPVAMGVCKICHRPASDVGHEFRLAREGSGLCAFCHAEIEAEASSHSGLLEGGCTLCHDPHGTDYRFLLSAPVADTCKGCHADVLRDRSVLHTPVGAEPCTSCHDPHDSRAGPSAAGSAGSCYRCHEAAWDGLEPDRVHEPLRSGDCGACHDPHGSNHVANLREDVPALCYECHEETMKKVETAKHTHTVAARPDGCLTCHDPHASTRSFGLRADPFTLCSECHAVETTSDDGTTLPAVVREIKASTYLHGPVRQRDCASCHDSHGSDHFRLLIENYSADFYASFDLENYKLCFTCHPVRKVMTERTTALTGFRNGDRNLHYLHITKHDPSRTCRACHATHASNRPKHIRNWVMFGQWQLPIDYRKTETGGSCRTGCHDWRAYDREVPVDYGDQDEPVAEERP